MDAPEIAVVVPTYRRLDRALRMIDALERQALPGDRFEVVMVDDSSGDGSVAALRQRAKASPLDIRVVSTPANSGPAAARNLGWRSTQATILAFTDDDCVPMPGWLAAGVESLRAAEDIGVVQGQTLRPPESSIGDWTLWREVTAPSPYFEGCNLFFRRATLAPTQGFDEGLARAAEDTAAGWAVLDGGWRRAFAPDAVVHHDVEERGARWHARHGFRERANLMAIAARHPAFRREAFWRPWAFQRDDALMTLAAVGVVAGCFRRPALLLVLPYVFRRHPPAGHPRPVRVGMEMLMVDGAKAAGVVVGALRHRLLVV